MNFVCLRDVGMSCVGVRALVDLPHCGTDTILVDAQGAETRVGNTALLMRQHTQIFRSAEIRAKFNRLLRSFSISTTQY